MGPYGVERGSYGDIERQLAQEKVVEPASPTDVAEGGREQDQVMPGKHQCEANVGGHPSGLHDALVLALNH